MLRHIIQYFEKANSERYETFRVAYKGNKATFYVKKSMAPPLFFEPQFFFQNMKKKNSSKFIPSFFKALKRSFRLCQSLKLVRIFFWIKF